MGSMYRSTVKVGEQEKVVVAIYHNDEDLALGQAIIESTVAERLHHIHVIDRSGSVYSNIDQLIDELQRSFDHVGTDDLITVIWYSGAGQFRTIVKGMSKSDKLVSKMDELRSVVGCTCFSDPMKEINLILDEIGDLAPVSVTLWTDGQPVVPWGVAEEERRCFAELAKMKDRILAFNVIGYGYSYNAELMRAFAATSEFGEAIHSSKISDFGKIFNHNFEKIADVCGESILIEGQDAEIIYLNRTFTKMASGVFHLSRIDKRKNLFFLFSEDGFDFDFTYNGVQYNSATCSVKAQLNPQQVANFYYSLAYNLYYNGKRREALEIVANHLRDKKLIDSHLSAFTFNEAGAHLELLNNALLKPAAFRMLDGEAPAGYLPADDALCVMDVLNALQLGESLYVPFGKNVEKYKRIGKKATDEIDIFVWGPDEVRARFSDFVGNKEKMNLSIRITIDGTVTINPKAAKRLNLATEFPSFIYRNHTVIKDGNINLPKIEVLLTDEDFMSPTISPVIERFIEHVDVEKDGAITTYSRCVLDLTTVPVINRKYVNEVTNIHDIFNHTVEVTRLEAFQKMIGYELEKYPVAERKASGAFSVLNNEQIDYLLEQGVQKDGSYGGFVTKAKAEDCDSYQARTMVFYIAGFTSWPKVTDLIERKAKIAAELAAGKGKSKLTPAMALLDEEWNSLSALLKADNLLLEKNEPAVMARLLDLQKKTKKQIQSIRGELNTLKIAKTLTGDWFEELVVDDKGNYSYEHGDIKMVARRDWTTEYFN